MTRWSLFLAGSLVIVALTVLFAVLTTRAVVRRRETVPADRWGDPTEILGVTRQALYLNAAGSQGLLLVVVLVIVLVTGVSWHALGYAEEFSLLEAVALGVGLGVVLTGVNLALQASLDAVGIGYDDSLRELLTPATTGQWLLLLGVVLPVVAVFEELLFRGILIGGFEAGFGISPWLLAVGSSIVFALGHGLQGRGGLIAAFVLGIALAIAFVLSGSLIAVIVAHYVVNTLEFVRYR